MWTSTNRGYRHEVSEGDGREHCLDGEDEVAGRMVSVPLVQLVAVTIHPKHDQRNSGVGRDQSSKLNLITVLALIFGRTLFGRPSPPEFQKICFFVSFLSD